MKIIALDLDGTLLTHDKRLTERTREALYKAAVLGNLIVPSTGRALKAIPAEILSLPFLRYVISINGASVSDEMTGERLYSANIPKQTALSLQRPTRYSSTMRRRKTSLQPQGTKIALLIRLH